VNPSIAARVRIRILLAVAVAVICGAVFVVAEVQRRSDAAFFEKYVAVRELRSAAMQMAIALGDALEQDDEAVEEMEAAERAVALTTAGIKLRLAGLGARERMLVEEQARAAIALAELTGQVTAGAPRGRLGRRRDALLGEFLAANDGLLTVLAAERRDARRRDARRPVILVIALSMLFGVLHLVLVERPARRERRSGRAQQEFGDAMKVARSEAEAYDVLARHVGQAAGALHVTALNRNNSADRLEPVTPVEVGPATAQGLEGAAPRLLPRGPPDAHAPPRPRR
jgi:hypothetical protein